MNVNEDSSGEESATDFILDLDFNPEGITHYLHFKSNMARLQGKEKPLSTKKVRKTSFEQKRRPVQSTTSWKTLMVLYNRAAKARRINYD